MNKHFFSVSVLLAGLVMFSCEHGNNEPDTLPTPEDAQAQGVYVLSEGGWGMNNASISYFDYEMGSFSADYYNAQNPSQGGLGDVGNDLMIYGAKMYAVVNSSNYVEVMNAKTAKHLTQIALPNGRALAFDGGFVYVSSFAGASYADGNQLGYVAKIDTATLQIVATVEVGYQPEEMAVTNGKLYVVNSGGYSNIEFSDKISVIDLQTFSVTATVSTGLSNLTKIRTDKNGTVWVLSNGNYSDVGSSLSVLDTKTNTITKTLNINISNFDFYENKIYYFGYSYLTGQGNFGVIDLETKTEANANFLTETAATEILIPYGMTVNQTNGDIFVSDALDYQSPGKVYCFDKNGNKKWVQTAGVLPAHFAVLGK